jgi:hypothetical protein
MSGEVWADDLSDITAADALAAMREHYRTSTEFLMPVHIVRFVRAMNAPDTMSPAVPQDCGAHKWTKDGSCAKCLSWHPSVRREA